MANDNYQKRNIPVNRKHPDYLKYYTEIKKEELAAYQKEWTSKNRDKETARWRKWYAKNKKERYIQTKEERIEKLKRIPPWADKEALKEFYRNCPDGYHVDHIIPLRGKTVSGLHVLENLQYLPAKENMAKGNKFIE